jgi:hypothetical protein
LRCDAIIEQTRLGVSGRTLRRRRQTGVAMIVAGSVLLLAGVWLGATALMARNKLNQARTEVHMLRAEISAGHWAADLANHAHRACQLTTGPVGAAAAVLPQGGEPLRTIRGITAKPPGRARRSCFANRWYLR